MATDQLRARLALSLLKIQFGAIESRDKQRAARFYASVAVGHLLMTRRPHRPAPRRRRKSWIAGSASRCSQLDGRRPNQAIAQEMGASMSLPSVLSAKQAINRSFEAPLSEGLRFERRIFHALFATDDQKEKHGARLEWRTDRHRERAGGGSS